jgi:hypothetical protein
MNKTLLILLLLISGSYRALAQPGSNPGGGVKPGVPITGLEWVLGAGALIGARKMYNKHKRSSHKDN